jgi:hypothetical protein
MGRFFHVAAFIQEPSPLLSRPSLKELLFKASGFTEQRGEE